MTDASDIQLVGRCLEGEAAATTLFVQKFERLVYSIALRMLGHHQDAEDVAQESLTRAIRYLGHWKQDRPLKPWLLAIVVNRCKTKLGLRIRPTSTSIDADWSSEFSTPATQTRDAMRAELAEELTRAICELKPEHRDVFELFYKDERSIEEISSLLNVPEGTIKTWLHRGRKTLAGLLRERDILPTS
jgi:RNA polymerase sigma-70 factor (ECF subfamily)